MTFKMRFSTNFSIPVLFAVFILIHQILADESVNTDQKSTDLNTDLNTEGYSPEQNNRNRLEYHYSVPVSTGNNEVNPIDVWSKSFFVSQQEGLKDNDAVSDNSKSQEQTSSLFGENRADGLESQLARYLRNQANIKDYGQQNLYEDPFVNRVNRGGWVGSRGKKRLVILPNDSVIGGFASKASRGWIGSRGRKRPDGTYDMRTVRGGWVGSRGKKSH